MCIHACIHLNLEALMHAIDTYTGYNIVRVASHFYDHEDYLGMNYAASL